MSGTIQTKIIAAVKSITAVKDKKTLAAQPDPNLTEIENLINIEGRLELVQQNVQVAIHAITDINVGIDQWTDLLRKLGAANDEENRLFTAFQTKYKLMEVLENGQAKIQGLQELENQLVIDVRMLKNSVDKNRRKEELEYQTAINQLAPAGMPAGAASSFSSFYSLPTLHIKPFRGDRRNWPEFFESFKSAIHNKPGAQAEKLNLLRNLLEGEPKALISGFRLEDRNYAPALQLLKDNYGDEQHTHIDD